MSIDTMGKRIRAARTYAGFTQQELAGMVKRDIRQVQRWEADETEISVSRIGEIAKATGVTVNFLHGDYPRLPTTWAPWIVIPTTSDTPETAEEAKRLVSDVTGEEWELEEVQEQIKDGWIEFLSGAIVVWQDGDRDPDTDLEYLMLVK